MKITVLSFLAAVENEVAEDILIVTCDPFWLPMPRYSMYGHEYVDSQYLDKLAYFTVVERGRGRGTVMILVNFVDSIHFNNIIGLDELKISMANLCSRKVESVRFVCAFLESSKLH